MDEWDKLKLRAKLSGHLNIDKDGYLVPSYVSGENPSLCRVAKVDGSPAFHAVEKELCATLVMSNVIRMVMRDGAFKKLSAATRDELEYVAAALE